MMIMMRMTITPTVPRNMRCEADNRGRCGQHGSKMIKIKVSKKTWSDRGKGRVFGWVTKKVPKFICSDAKKTPDVRSNIPRISDRADFSSSTQNSSAVLGERLHDVGDLQILEHSME